MRPDVAFWSLQLFSSMEAWSEAEGGVPLSQVYTSPAREPTLRMRFNRSIAGWSERAPLQAFSAALAMI